MRHRHPGRRTGARPGAGLARAANPDGGAAAGRHRGGQRRAHPRAQTLGRARTKRGGREPGRRIGPDRHRAHRQIRAGRLHHRLRQRFDTDDAAEPESEAALRPAERPGAGGARGRQQLRCRGTGQFGRQDTRRADRASQGQTGRHPFQFGRQRQSSAPGDGTAGRQRRREDDPCALQGRLASAHRPGRRAGPGTGPGPGRDGAAGQGRKNPPAGHHRHRTLAADPRRADSARRWIGRF